MLGTLPSLWYLQIDLSCSEINRVLFGLGFLYPLLGVEPRVWGMLSRCSELPGVIISRWDAESGQRAVPSQLSIFHIDRRFLLFLKADLKQ